MEEDKNVEEVVEQETPVVNPIDDILRAAGIGVEETEEENVEPEDKSVEEPAKEVDNPATEEAEFYTIEELTEMGKSETLDKINTAKIPPELQAVYKSLNAMATRRQQSLAEKEKELSARLQQAQEQALREHPRRDIPIEQKVYTDPVGAMRDIYATLEATNQKIHEAQAKDDIFEVQKLLVEKDTLKDKYLAVQNVIQSANSEWETIYKTIPDFQEKAPKLRGFTKEVLGDDEFTDAEMNWLTNPVVTGKISSKIVKLVNNLYDMKVKYEASLKTTEEKLKKAKPTPSLSPGSEDVIPNKTNVKALRDRAKATNDDLDIAAYIAAITKG